MAEDSTNTSYRVLARKYRPSNFSELVGQDVLVKTLTNAIKNDRIAHAFILTGIRGIGKTSTARIIAKVLNCLGEDRVSGKSVDPCGMCSVCTSIANSTYQDVIEIDAASRTGVGDMREIIDNINYAPVSAKYKVYIIDEVHMLSNQAFNALLKTLEEPPAHVKFIFATTEIRKVPITILSRCQRFDLKRLNNKELLQHLLNIVKSEGFEAEEEALSMIVAAAEGSARDSLSLLDQAFSHNNYEKMLSATVVADMLGLVGKGRVYDLFEAIASGNIEKALEFFEDIYQGSLEPSVLLQDLLEITHQVTLAKTVKNYDQKCDLPQDQKARVREIAENISVGSLAKIWQMLLKGSSEVKFAPNAVQATEMLIIRMCYSADLPNPSQLIKDVKGEKGITTTSDSNNKGGNEVVSEILKRFSDAEIIS